MPTAKLLGQLLLMQSVVVNLPDEAIPSFVSRGLSDLPGVTGVRLLGADACAPAGGEESFPLRLNGVVRGLLCISVTDPDAFSPYRLYLENFCFMLAVILEEREQRRRLASHTAELERLVQERTSRLSEEVETRRATERALRSSERRFREVVEGTDNLITQVDAEGRFLYVNPVARKIFGLSPRQCIGRLAFDFVHPDDREATRAAFNEWVGSRRNHVSFENRLVSTTGGVRHLRWTIRLRFGKAGRLTVVDSIAQDVTDIRRAEESLHRSQELLQVCGDT